jgi:hypothetical protein
MIIETTKAETGQALKKHIGANRPCMYFVIQNRDEAINNGYQKEIEHYDDQFFELNNLIIIKP